MPGEDCGVTGVAKLKLRTLGCKFAGQSAELDPAGSRPREDCGVDGLPGATILLLAGHYTGVDRGGHELHNCHLQGFPAELARLQSQLSARRCRISITFIVLLHSALGILGLFSH